MSATRLDGRAAAREIAERLRGRVAVLRDAGIQPGIATVLVGEDPASELYVGMKHRQATALGMHSERVTLPADIDQAGLDAAIDALNADAAIHGMIVQLPLPGHLDTERTLARIDPAKDADGLHPWNLGQLVLQVAGELTVPVPCTPRGVIALLEAHDVPLGGAHVVVVGRGVTIGRPIPLLLTRRGVNATVTLTHTGTRDLAALTQQADVIVAAAGVPHMITPSHVRAGAAVLDVGVTRRTRDDGSQEVLGDVQPDVASVAGWLAPNPGGVGPMTVAMLLTNVVEAAERASRQR